MHGLPHLKINIATIGMMAGRNVSC